MPDHELAFTRSFADLPDPRANRTRKHSLHDILGVTLCAVICGADSFDEIARFGQARVSWLRHFFPLPNGIPSHDTFHRVLADLCQGRGSSRSPSTARRAGRPTGTRSAGACTW